MAMDGPGMGEIPPAILDDIMRTSHVVHPAAGHFNGVGANETVPSSEQLKPQLVILEQPKSRGFRFRYDCEGQSHGGLPGENSDKKKIKSYPTVQLLHYRGRARIVISLVTESDPPYPHAHSIVGKNTENGQCTVEIGPESDMCATFPNLGILHVTRKKVVDVLVERFTQQLLLQEKRSESAVTGEQPQLSDDDREMIRSEAERIGKNMNLSVVRLCFQAFLPDENGRFTLPLEPVFSQKVYDSKAPSAATLKISRLDRHSGSVNGGDEVFLLCDKVQKNDVEVIFYEDVPMKVEGSVNNYDRWEAKAEFGPHDVHHQYAIVFRTPAYFNRVIERQVVVNVALRRPSDREVSEPRQFTYLPQEFDEEKIGQKRRKKINHFNQFFDAQGGNPSSGGGSFFGSFGDGGSSSWSFGMGGAGATGSGHGNMHSLGGNVSNYGNHHHHQPQQQQQYHSMMGSSRQSYAPPLPPVSSMFMPSQENYPHYPPSNSGPWNYNYGIKDRGAGSRPEVKSENDSMASLKSMETSASSSRATQLKGQIDKEAEESGYMEGSVQVTTEDDALMQSLQQRQMQAYRLCERMFDALMHWARTKDVRYLLAAQRSLTAVQNTDGDTVIHVAIINQQEDVVATLLDILPTLPASETPVVDCLNNFKQSPLHLSVLTKQHRVAEHLLMAGANPLVCDRNGNTALHLSAHMGYPEAMKCLLERKSHLVTAPITVPSDMLIMNVNGHTPAHLAALCGSIDCLKLLHQAGANLSIQDGKSGRTPLHYAVEKNDIALCGYLLVDASGDPDQTDFSGNTPLHVAASLGNAQLINLLVSGGADCTVKNLEGETPLDLAKVKEHDEAIRVLENITSEDLHDQEISQQLENITLSTQSTSVSTATSKSDDAPASSIIKIESDMDDLDYMTRMKLSLLLDVSQDGKDWKELCVLLGLEPLLAAFNTVSSPTRELLNYYEASGGTISQLRSCLIEMCRNDCVTVIDRDTGRLPLPDNTQQPSNNTGESASGKMSYDSGISSGPPGGIFSSTSGDAVETM